MMGYLAVFDPDSLTSHYIVAAICLALIVMSFFFGKAWSLTVAFGAYGYLFSRFEHTSFWLWYCCLIYICHVAIHLANGRPFLRWLHRNVLQRMLIWTTPGVLFAHHNITSITGWALNAVQVLLGMGLIIHELDTCVPCLRKRSLRWKWMLLLMPLTLSLACWSVCVWNEHVTIALAEDDAAKQLGLSTPVHLIPHLSDDLPPILPPALSSLESSLAKSLFRSGMHPLAAETPLYLVATAMQSFEGPRQVIGSSVTVLYCEIDLWLEEASSGHDAISMRAQSAGSLRKRQQIGCGRPRTLEYTISKPQFGDSSLQEVYAAMLELERDVGNLILNWQDVEAEYTELYHRLTLTLNALDSFCAKYDAGSDVGSWLNNAHAIPCSSKRSPQWLPIPLPACVAQWSVGTPYGFGAWWQLFEYIFTPTKARRFRKTQRYLQDAILHAIKQLQKVCETDKAQNSSQIPKTTFSKAAFSGNLQWRLSRIETEQRLANKLVTDQMLQLLQTFANEKDNDAIALVTADSLSGNGFYGHFMRARVCTDARAKDTLGQVKEVLEIPQSDRRITE